MNRTLFITTILFFFALFTFTEASYSGKATWFIPSKEGGSAGACGGRNSDSASIVALNAAQYGNMSKKSKHCGKKVKITYNGKSATAKITDACPGCKYGSLDLTQPLFKKFAKLNKGVIKIKWNFV